VDRAVSDRGVRYTPFLLAAALVPALWAKVAIGNHGVWEWRFTVGLLLIVPSFLLWAIARHQLGDAFTGRAEARRLVTHGLYARIRHPIYLFAECTVIGIIIFMDLPLLLLVWVPAVVWQISRARREDRVLEEAFGDSFRRYRQRTWF
jgi:protein-S-isoprenylcysteine O-methyltransferase Ste14